MQSFMELFQKSVERFRAMARWLTQSALARPLIVGFALLCLCMAGLGYLGLFALRGNNAHLERIVHEHNRKANLINTLRNVTRERALLVYKMTIAPDPFERDELMLRFRDFAAQYIQAREALRRLPFTPEEAAIFTESQRKILESTRLMEEVVTLALDEQDEAAKQKLVTEAVPAQNRVQADFARLIEYQTRISESAARAAQKSYRNTYAAMAVLGLAMLALGLLVSGMVLRRASAIERALASEKDLAEVTLHSIGDAVITTDAKGCIDRMNEMAQRLTGWRIHAARGQPVDRIYRVERAREGTLETGVSDCLRDGSYTPGLEDLRLISRTGLQFSIEQSVAPIRDHQGAIVGVVVVFRDVTLERSLSQELAWQASHDALTGLVNRHEFERRLQELLDQARGQRMRHAMLYIDLDQFKLVNDTCGHVAGDELLRQISAIMIGKIRTVDTFARLGGDEFALLLPGCELGRAAEIAEKLRAEIAAYRLVWEDKTFAVGASIGLVEINAESESIASLMSAADSACYLAKHRGRNRVCIHRAQDEAFRQLHGEVEWVSRLTQAFEQNRFRLYYQSIRSLREGAAPEFREILLRMLDEEGNLVPPMAFIPAAERYTLMPTVDRWVMRTTLAWMKDRLASLPRDVHFAINLSGQTLSDEAFADFVEEQFTVYGVSPDRICFEITETAAIANLAHATRLMTRLREKGCGFALDDFGSGMSSFSYLKHLPVDSIKIDGSFVRDMLNDPMDHAMVEAMVRIGHVLGLRTVAEYVESEAIRDVLRELGMDYGQGYAVHSPEPLA